LEVSVFLHGLEKLNVDFFTGVPDSLLKPLNDTLFSLYGLNGCHVVAANEGNAVGLAAGHAIATGHPAMVYLQNSGLGNIVNPVTSLLSGRVYGIPCVFVVGWRGEPGVADEPQHAFQGRITREQLALLELTTFELDAATDYEDFKRMLAQAAPLLAAGGSVAFLVHKGGLTGGGAAIDNGARDSLPMREEALEKILRDAQPDDFFVSTTGKTSREVFELRVKLGQDHAHDFLTVGSMGHAGMIALGIAKAKPDRMVWCLDGDGAALMHLGALAVEAQQGCRNLIHVVFNNGAHESVGGMPVVGGELRFAPVARELGFAALSSEKLDDLPDALRWARQAAGEGPCLLEILLRQGSRADLGRPTQTPKENLHALTQALRGEAER